jgi:pyruvate dehydrogenase E1 component beta subunit
VARLAVPDTPIPYARPLEYYVLPTAEKILDTSRRLVGA